VSISAKLVKELREKTGAGMMDCKKALVEVDGDLEKAVDFLREKGISQAAKKADRVASEGLAKIKIDGNVAAIVEVNSETDFVAKNDQFILLIDNILEVLTKEKPTALDEVLALKSGDGTLQDQIDEGAAKIGEKISLRRFTVIEKTDGESFGDYAHMGGRIAVLSVLKGSDNEAARNIAMHVAANNPKYVSKGDVPNAELEHEKEVLKQQALNEGKPENIVDKMVQGRLSKFLEEICLDDQDFVKDADQKVKNYLTSKGLEVKTFVRYEVGEGLEKRQENFAEEVQAQMKN